MPDELEFKDEREPEATNNAIRPEDGEQDVLQDPNVAYSSDGDD